MPALTSREMREIDRLAVEETGPGLLNPASGRLYVADLGIPAGATVRIGVEPPLYGPAFDPDITCDFEPVGGAHRDGSAPRESIQ